MKADGLPLLKVRTDRHYVREQRTARWPDPIDIEMWESPVHRKALEKRMWGQWAEEYARVYGIKPAPGPREVAAVTYVDYDGDATADPGPVPPPDPRKFNPDQIAQYERIERQRAAAAKTVEHDLVPVGDGQFVELIARTVVQIKLRAWWWVPHQDVIAKPSSLVRHIQPSKN